MMNQYDRSRKLAKGMTGAELAQGGAITSNEKQKLEKQMKTKRKKKDKKIMKSERALY